MDEVGHDDVPEHVREEVRIRNISNGIVKDILRNLWWSKGIPYAFAVDEEGLAAELERYLYEASF
jgi:hypothetical protein